MKFSDKWLAEHIGNAELAKLSQLTDLGFPLELIKDPRLGEYFCIGRVVSLAPHLHADRLRICVVDDGKGHREIVCGDCNLQENQITVVALPGAVLPDGTKIKKSKLRGIESAGMLCSEKELGLEVTHDGVINLESKYTQARNYVGHRADELLASEGRIWDIEVGFNRPDMLCIAGIARELVAIQNRAQALDDQKDYIQNNPIKINDQFTPVISSNQKNTHINIDLKGDWHALFCVAHMPNKTPQYIQERIALRGCGTHTFPVDLTNYIMYDCGHPMHAFDADKIQGTLVLREAREDEEIELLSGESIALKAGIMIFADDLGPISVAGVMGGKRTGCDESTKRILFETMWLNDVPQDIAHSDSWKLFSRGADKLGPRKAMHKTLELLNTHGCKCEKVYEFGKPEENQRLEFKKSDIAKILGVESDPVPYLEKLGFRCIPISKSNQTTPNSLQCSRINIKITSSEQQEYECILPSWRSDISTTECLAEEVGRIYGYDKIPIIRLELLGKLHQKSTNIREMFLTMGLHESYNNHLVSSSTVTPVNSRKGLRQSLLPGLWEICKQQLRQKVIQWPGIFEVGACFALDNDKLQKPNNIPAFDKMIKYLQDNDLEINKHNAVKYLQCNDTELDNFVKYFHSTSTNNTALVDFFTPTARSNVCQIQHIAALCNPDLPQFGHKVLIQELITTLQDTFGLKLHRRESLIKPKLLKKPTCISFATDNGVWIWAGTLDPALTYKETRNLVYALECSLPTHQKPIAHNLRPRNCDQVWRDVTVEFDGHSLELYIALRNQISHSEIDFIEQYNKAVTFRVWMDSTADIENLILNYKDLMVKNGARLTD